jgi:hypothetical protein
VSRAAALTLRGKDVKSKKWLARDYARRHRVNRPAAAGLGRPRVRVRRLCGNAGQLMGRRGSSCLHGPHGIATGTAATGGA